MYIYMKAYLGRLAPNTALTPPADPNVTTLWVGGVEEDVTDNDLLSLFYPYGQVVSVRISRGAGTKGCAFVQFATRLEAETAASNLYNSLYVRGKLLNLNWARPRNTDTDGGVDAAAPITLYSNPNTGYTITSADASFVPPPPGMENAPIGSYSLPGMTAPVALPTANRSSDTDTDTNTSSKSSKVIDASDHLRSQVCCFST